jgi:hypothetical protein
MILYFSDVSIDYSGAEKFKKDGGFAGYFKVKTQVESN